MGLPLPQHEALSSAEPPAHAGSRGSLPALHKASSAHAQAGKRLGIFNKNKGHFVPGKAHFTLAALSRVEPWRGRPLHCPHEPASDCEEGRLPKELAAEVGQPHVGILQVPDGRVTPQSLGYGPSSRP